MSIPVLLLISAWNHIVILKLQALVLGIPQINRVTSDYVTHLKNGYILEEVTQFEEAASYYLDQLKYWNQALIEAIEKIRENTGERFIEKWEHYLKGG